MKQKRPFQENSLIDPYFEKRALISSSVLSFDEYPVTKIRFSVLGYSLIDILKLIKLFN